MSKRTLHIVDGDSASGTLRQTALGREGEVLSWRDALYSGPVPEGMSLRQLSRSRSKFWTAGKSSREFVSRDANLATYGDYEEVVLWFGSDCTLCELRLVQLLSWFGEEKRAPKRLSWVAEHGGVLNPTQMVQAYSRRRAVTSGHMRIAKVVWQAFRSPTPARLSRLLSRRLSVPGLKRAITWVLREYPGKGDGLSRLQRKLLKEIESREETRISVAVAAVLSAESVGDSFLFDLLKRCVEVKNPLVKVVRNGKGHLRYKSQVVLTDLGRGVLRRKADHVQLNGVDYWIGGVHLVGNEVSWRWDKAVRRIVSARGGR